MNQLTRRQAEVLDAITRLKAEKGYPPTIREIGDELGICSPNGVHQHLLAMLHKGVVNWTPKASRSLRVIREDDNRGIPLLTLDEISRVFQES